MASSVRSPLASVRSCVSVTARSVELFVDMAHVFLLLRGRTRPRLRPRGASAPFEDAEESARDEPGDSTTQPTTAPTPCPERLSHLRELALSCETTGLQTPRNALDPR